MKFVIRDDDLNFYSMPADIKRWYADLFAAGIPVGFATIPSVKPTSDVYTAGHEEGPEEHAISANQELVQYVQSQPCIEVLQHGTTHETVGGVYEYQNPEIALGEALRGREELERAFGVPVSVFVPPHDWIGTAGIRAIEHARMNVIRGRGAGIRNFFFRGAYLANFIRMATYKAWRSMQGPVPAYTHVLNFGEHKEVCSYRLEDTDIRKGLTYAHDTDGIFVVVLHVHFITEEKKKFLWSLIEQAREYGAEFVRPSTLFT